MAIALNIPSQIEKYLSLSLFPATGNDFTLYIANDTNRLYQWDGSAYVEVSQQDAVNWGSIGGDILNQTDLQLALAGKEPTIAAGTTSQYFRGDKTFQTLDKSAVGLANVDNTSDANKPISTATQTALNAKQNSLGYTPVPETRTLTINGTTQDLSADRTFTISTGITIGTTAITSGTVGRVLFEGTGNVVQESANLFWDNTNGRLGLGTASPTQRLEVNGQTILRDAITLSSAGDRGRLTWGGGYFGIQALGSEGISFLLPSNARVINIPNATGNVLINTTTDAGFKLDVNGTARVSGLVTASLSNYNSTHTGNTTRGFYIVNSADSVIRAGIEYDGTNAFVQLAGRYNNGSPFFRQNGGNGDISFLRSGTEFGRIFGATGNWGINTTTDAGFRLDVNGTARVQGNVTISTATPILNINVTNNSQTSAIYMNAVDGNPRGGIMTNISSGEVRFLAGTGGYFQTFYNSGSEQMRLISGDLLLGTTTSISSAKFVIESTTKGFLPPRMTTTQKNAIASPAAGLMVYDTTLNLISVYNGTTWI